MVYTHVRSYDAWVEVAEVKNNNTSQHTFCFLDRHASQTMEYNRQLLGVPAYT